MMSTTVHMFPDITEIERRVLKFIEGRKSQDNEFSKKCVNISVLEEISEKKCKVILN